MAARIYDSECEAGRCFCLTYRGVRLEDLFGGDGPYNPIMPGDKLRLDFDAQTVYSETQETEETN